MSGVRPISSGRGIQPATRNQSSFGNTPLNQGFNQDIAQMTRSNVTEIVSVPQELSDFASATTFNEILLNVKKQTNINHIDRQMEAAGRCSGIVIAAPSTETATNARKLVETHFKNRIKIMSMEARLAKTQSDLFSAQGEMASGMMVDFTIPTTVIGLVIGKAGARIKQIEKETGVSSINVDGNTGKVMVVGPDARSVSIDSSNRLPLFCEFIIYYLLFHVLWSHV